ncbi:MAG: hypothetical protein F6K17_34000 [Okeania sp. SIO3C4]|nr:hypothetical protein [Okeania sp. SIO3C4]
MLEQKTVIIESKADAVPNVDMLILSDYVEDRLWPIFNAVKEHIKQGKRILAIGDGVKTLIDWGELPGRLGENNSARIFSEEVEIEVVNKDHLLTKDLNSDSLLLTVSGTHCRWDLAHGYTAAMENGRILFRYQSKANDIVDVKDETQTVAGIANEAGNVFGLLFHPERAVDDEIGNTDGRGIFTSMMMELQTA